MAAKTPTMPLSRNSMQMMNSRLRAWMLSQEARRVSGMRKVVKTMSSRLMPSTPTS
jgi:hypothetical protein